MELLYRAEEVKNFGRFGDHMEAFRATMVIFKHREMGKNHLSHLIISYLSFSGGRFPDVSTMADQ